MLRHTTLFVLQYSYTVENRKNHELYNTMLHILTYFSPEYEIISIEFHQWAGLLHLDSACGFEDVEIVANLCAGVEVNALGSD